MVKSDLLPTTENLIKTFFDNAIDRNADIADFVRLINSISTSYSIALDGAWGSGKTFFVKQTKMIFDSFNDCTQVEHRLTEDEKNKLIDEFSKYIIDELKINNFVSVYFDAWEYDYDDDPLQSLIYQISKDVSAAYKVSKKYDFLGIATSIIDNLAGRDTKGLLEKLKGDSVVGGTAANKNLQELVNEYFENLLPEHGDRLVIFVDELDRCNPQYAVRLLERMKHYFINDKITFVFSVNKEQLQHTVKKHYGNDFDAYNYLDRFFDLTVTIPKCNTRKYIDSISEDMSDLVYVVSTYLANKFDMSLRSASRYFDFLLVSTKDLSGIRGMGEAFCFHFILPLALALKSTNYDKYISFINGNESAYFKEIMMGNDEVVENIKEYYLDYNADISNELINIYNAVFIETPNKDTYMKIHRMHITKSVKELLIKKLSLLDKNVTY